MAALTLRNRRPFPRIIEQYRDGADVIFKEQEWGLNEQETVRRFFATQYGPESKPTPTSVRVTIGAAPKWDTVSGFLEFGDVGIDARSGLPIVGLGNGETCLLDGKWTVSGPLNNLSAVPDTAAFPNFQFPFEIRNGDITRL